MYKIFSFIKTDGQINFLEKRGAKAHIKISAMSLITKAAFCQTVIQLRALVLLWNGVSPSFYNMYEI